MTLEQGLESGPSNPTGRKRRVRRLDLDLQNWWRVADNINAVQARSCASASPSRSEAIDGLACSKAVLRCACTSTPIGKRPARREGKQGVRRVHVKLYLPAEL